MTTIAATADAAPLHVGKRITASVTARPRIDPTDAFEFLTIGEVREITRLSIPTIYRSITANRFPAPVKFGAKSLWIRREVRDWIGARIAERDARIPR